MKDLLSLAKEDFEIAQLLYKEKRYNNALYHYHQSVEKAAKYIGRSIGGISELQLKEISHDQIKFYKTLFKYFEQQSNGLVPPFDPHIFTNMKELIEKGTEEEIIKNARDLILEIRNGEKLIDEQKFSSPLVAIEKYATKTIPDLDLGIDDELIKQYISVKLKDEIAETIILINYGIKILLILFANSLICCKYKLDEFRYPSKRIGNPAEYFNINNPLVKELPFFLSSMVVPIEFSPKIKWNGMSKII